MKRIINTTYKYMQWVVMGLLLISYFAYLIVDFEDGSIILQFNDWRIYAHLGFVVTMQMIMVSAGTDMSIKNSVRNERFKEANKAHQKLVKKYFNNFDAFKFYVDESNNKRKAMVEEMYLVDKGCNSVDELTKKGLKEYNKLTYDKIDLRGFTKPLIEQSSKERGVTSTDISTNLQGRKVRKQISKVVVAVLLATLSYNITFNISNFGNAITSTIFIGAQLLITLLLTYSPNYYRLTELVPELVEEKMNIYIGFSEKQDEIEAKLRKIEQEKQAKLKQDNEVVDKDKDL